MQREFPLTELHGTLIRPHYPACGPTTRRWSSLINQLFSWGGSISASGVGTIPGTGTVLYSCFWYKRNKGAIDRKDLCKILWGALSFGVVIWRRHFKKFLWSFFSLTYPLSHLYFTLLRWYSGFTLHRFHSFNEIKCRSYPLNRSVCFFHAGWTLKIPILPVYF